MATIKKITLTVRIGDDFNKSLDFKDSSDNPINITGYSFKLQVRKCKNSTTPILTLTSPADIIITDAVNGKIMINITDTVTLTLAEQNAVYDLKWTTAANIVTTILEGNFEILETVTK